MHDDQGDVAVVIDRLLALRDPEKRAAFLAMADNPPKLTREQRRLAGRLREMDKHYRFSTRAPAISPAAG
jgi:hypothetical protein